LLAPIQPTLNRLAERTTQDHVGTAGRVLFAHVHDGDRRQRPIEDAALEHDAFVLAGHRAIVALHRWRGRTQHGERAGPLRADDGDVTAVVARALVLLVRGVVLFVDDDEPEPFKRSEHGRAGADDDVDVAAPDPLPLVVPLAGREPAVLNRHAIAKVLAA